MIKVIIIDDSNFMRVSLSRMLSNDPDIEVVGTFRNGKDALRFLEENRVHVIILDFFMPKMSGLETLESIMKTHPTPTLMLTSKEEGMNEDLYFKAMNLGAFDIIDKPSGSQSLHINEIEELLIGKIKLAAGLRPRKILPHGNDSDSLQKQTDSPSNGKEDISKSIINKAEAVIRNNQKIRELIQERKKKLENKEERNQNTSLFSHKEKSHSSIILTKDSQKRIKSYRTYRENRSENKILIKEKLRVNNPIHKLIIIGASTGGPKLLAEFIKKIRFDPSSVIIIVQHMPAGFTSTFAGRLDQQSPYHIKEAEDGEYLLLGYGYVAPGDYHLKFEERDGFIITKLDHGPKVQNVRPSIDVTMISAASLLKERCIGIILTGMGKDGSEGLRTIKKFSGITYCQDPNEAFISSMPEHAIKTGAVDYSFPIEKLVLHLNKNVLG